MDSHTNSVISGMFDFQIQNTQNHAKLYYNQAAKRNMECKCAHKIPGPGGGDSS